MPPWRVFVSHTAELRPYLTAVERAISAAGHVVVEMAGFPASADTSADLCAARVRECDVYLGVLGTRYGSDGDGGVRPGRRPGPARSGLARRQPSVVMAAG